MTLKKLAGRVYARDPEIARLVQQAGDNDADAYEEAHKRIRDMLTSILSEQAPWFIEITSYPTKATETVWFELVHAIYELLLYAEEEVKKA